MGERGAYYDRQEKSSRYKSEFMSDISDGMASDKCKVPCFADQFETKKVLKQHVR